MCVCVWGGVAYAYDSKRKPMQGFIYLFMEMYIEYQLLSHEKLFSVFKKNQLLDSISYIFLFSDRFEFLSAKKKKTAFI